MFMNWDVSTFSRTTSIQSDNSVVLFYMGSVSIRGRKSFVQLACFAVFEDEDENEDDFKPVSQSSAL